MDTWSWCWNWVNALFQAENKKVNKVCVEPYTCSNFFFYYFYSSNCGFSDKKYFTRFILHWVLEGVWWVYMSHIVNVKHLEHGQACCYVTLLSEVSLTSALMLTDEVHTTSLSASLADKKTHIYPSHLADNQWCMMAVTAKFVTVLADIFLDPAMFVLIFPSHPTPVFPLGSSEKTDYLCCCSWTAETHH